MNTFDIHGEPDRENLNLLNRKSLMSSLPKGGIGAEIGVSEGVFSDKLLEACKPKTLYLIDPWQFTTSETLRGDSSNVCQEEQEIRYCQVQNRLGSEPNVRVLRMYSVPASKTFDDGFFDWVHIDANHTQAEQDIEAWWRKIKSGGWLTGHDYTMLGTHITVKEKVDSFVTSNELELFVTIGDDNIYEVNYPSWAIRKP